MKVTDFVPKIPSQTKGKIYLKSLGEEGKVSAFIPWVKKAILTIY